MNSRELQAELFSAAARVTQGHLDRLRGLGVSPATIAALGRSYVPFGVVNLTTESTGTYQPGDGAAHIVQPVVEDGELIDLVAWHTLRPGRWWLRNGVGWAINPEGLGEFDRWGDGPPVLHASPLDWLRAGGTGSVILDWSNRVAINELRAHDSIACASSELAGTLRKAMMATVRMPSFTVERGALYA